MDEILRSGASLYEKVIDQIAESKGDKVYSDGMSFIGLEEWKRKELPKLLKQRYEKENSNVFLTRDELAKLLDWKLSRGKFRPALKKYINSNSETDVEKITSAGFELMISYGKRNVSKDKARADFRFDEYQETVVSAINTFTKLSGVGAAMASLILSLLSLIVKDDDVLKLKVPPFFSDEAYEFFMSSTRQGIKIKYTLKEYLEYLRVTIELSEELKIMDCNIIEDAFFAVEKMKSRGAKGQISMENVKLTESENKLANFKYSQSKDRIKNENNSTAVLTPKKRVLTDGKGTTVKRRK